jgi:hypothetical protein
MIEITIISALVILVLLPRLEASEISTRIQMALAAIGIDYKPSKITCITIAALIFFVLFFIVFNK